MNLLDRARLHADRLAAWLVGALGFLALFLGYRGTSGTGLIAQQLSYIVSGGIIGLTLVGVSGVLWLSADLRDQWRELYEVRAILERQQGQVEGMDGTSTRAKTELAQAGLGPARHLAPAGGEPARLPASDGAVESPHAARVVRGTGTARRPVRRAPEAR